MEPESAAPDASPPAPPARHRRNRFIIRLLVALFVVGGVGWFWHSSSVEEKGVEQKAWRLLAEIRKEDWRRFAAVTALIGLGTPPAREGLKGCLEDRAPAIRRLVARGLTGEGALSLAGTLREREKDFRHYAARALVFFNDPATLSALREASQDTDSDVRAAARLAVRRIERLASRRDGAEQP